jgi:TonB family protein
MRRNITKALLQSSFILSILCHLALLMSFSLVFVVAPMPEIKVKPYPYVQSYTYDEDNSRAARHPTTTKAATSKKVVEEKSILHELETRQGNQAQSAASTINSEAVHLIGKKKLDKPLLKIIGKALTASFIYPKIAADFHTRGTVVVGFTLYPDGHITALKLVQSSSADVLDQAVLAAVNRMSPVKNVGPYVDKPQYIEFGVIF